MAENRTVTARVVKRNPTEYSEVLRGLKPSRNPFGQFLPLPNNYCVEIQQADEKNLIIGPETLDNQRKVGVDSDWFVAGGVVFIPISHV